MSEIDFDALEATGRDRAEKSRVIWEETGKTPPDNFDDEPSGITVWDPYTSTCGRFDVDPYMEYGRGFVEWLLSVS